MSSSLRLPSSSQSDDYNGQGTVVDVRGTVATAPAVLVQHYGADGRQHGQRIGS